jgi:hypothetical protein
MYLQKLKYLIIWGGASNESSFLFVNLHVVDVGKRAEKFKCKNFVEIN